MTCSAAFCPALSTKCQARSRVVARARASDSMQNHSSASRRDVASSAAATDNFAGTFEAFTMDAQQDTLAFGAQGYEERIRATGSDVAHKSFTDSEQASEEAADERNAARRQRRNAMVGWGKSGGFPTPPSDSTSSKPNNVDF